MYRYIPPANITSSLKGIDRYNFFTTYVAFKRKEIRQRTKEQNYFATSLQDLSVWFELFSRFFPKMQRFEKVRGSIISRLQVPSK